MSNRNKIWFSVLISVILTSILILILPQEELTTINVISIIGFVLSVLGLIIAYLQIMSIKDIANETRIKVNESIELNSRIMMISDLSKKVVMIDEIQGYIKANKIEMCILRMKDLKIVLLNLKSQERYSSLFTKKKFNDVFQTFNINLNNFQAHYLNEKFKIDKPSIIRNMEELSSLLLSVELKLKIPNHDQ